MDLWPGIDIREGRCVRLFRGDFATETDYGDPVELAVRYVDEGAERLHVVDLDAARTGSPVNREVIYRIVRLTGALVQAGGGVRDSESAAALLDGGVARVVVGTAAITRFRSHFESMAARWPGRVAAGLDYRTEREGELGTPRHELAVRGWTEPSGVTLEDVLDWLADLPIAALVVTDIRRDGTGVGPAFPEYEELLPATSQPVIASGGVGSVEDIVRLARIEAAGRKISGVVVGKALASGAMTVRDARKAAQGMTL